MTADSLKIPSAFGLVELVKTPMHRLGSADNTHDYPLELVIGDGHDLSSMRGVLVNGRPTALLAGSRGATGLHAHAAVVIDDALYIAVGDSVACLGLRPFALRWATRTDDATCFGVHFDASRSALISHGELEIARLSPDGHILWSASGADIFSEGLTLAADAVEAIDFNERRYRFDYDSGAELGT